MYLDYVIAAALIVGLWLLAMAFGGTTFRRVVGSASRTLCALLEGLAVSARRNMPMPVALRLLAEESPRRFRRSLDRASAQAAGGEALGDALKCLGNHIPAAYTTAISACERRGGLADVLDRVAKHQAAKLEGKRRLLSLMAYPVFLGFICCVVMAGIFVFILPKFERMFSDMAVELPGITLAVFGAIEQLAEYWWSLPLLIVLCGALGSAFYTTLVFRRPFAWLTKPVDYLLFLVPGLRRYLLYAGVRHVVESMAIVLRAGAPVHEAVRASADIDVPHPLHKRMVKAAALVEQGSTLADALRSVGMFPRNVVWLLGLGESTGELADACTQAAELVQHRAEHMVRCAFALVLPLSILAIGLVELFVIVAFYIPLVMLAGSVG